MVAKAIHNNSVRAHRPFVAVNCGTLEGDLVNSTLFGHVKGAFTGASHDHKGIFEQAKGGTVFLDEIGDMPLASQVRLLRVLQEGMITRVGGDQTQIAVDVRIIAATHVNLEKKIKDKEFREDLFFRLNVLGLNLAPLRDRLEDIEPLVLHFLDDLRITKSAIERLKEHPWRGNVRQLQNAISRLAIKARGLGKSKVDIDDLTQDFFDSISIREDKESLTQEISLGATIKEFNQQVSLLEKGFWEEQLKRVSNVSLLAKTHNISRATLYRKLGALGITH